MKNCVAFGALALAAGVSSGATVATWNVGSGQYRNNFLLNSSSSFGGGNTLELGLRTVNRQSAVLAELSGSTYTVHNGHQGAYGLTLGAPVNTARNRWNFDYHIYYSGGVQNLDSLTMTITSPLGNTVSAPFFNMKVANNDNVNVGNGDSQPVAFFIQDSQNPVFAPWFTGFNMNVAGTYTFTLTAVEGGDTMTQFMQVNVIPAPLAATAGLAGLLGVASVRRRRA